MSNANIYRRFLCSKKVEKHCLKLILTHCGTTSHQHALAVPAYNFEFASALTVFCSACIMIQILYLEDVVATPRNQKAFRLERL